MKLESLVWMPRRKLIPAPFIFAPLAVLHPSNVSLNLDLSNICSQFVLFDHHRDYYYHDDYDRRQQL
jgi:hypothetical protein